MEFSCNSPGEYVIDSGISRRSNGNYGQLIAKPIRPDFEKAFHEIDSMESLEGREIIFVH